MSFAGGGNCVNLNTSDSVSVNSGTITITITPTTEGNYAGCSLVVTDNGDNTGNGHSTANTGSITLDDFCYGGVYYLDADGDGYSDGTSSATCTDP